MNSDRAFLNMKMWKICVPRRFIGGWVEEKEVVLGTGKYSHLGQRLPISLCSAWCDFCICTLVAIICLVMNVRTTAGEQMVPLFVWIFFQPRFCLSLTADSVAHLLSIFESYSTTLKLILHLIQDTIWKTLHYFCNLIGFLMYLLWSLYFYFL